MTRPYIIGICGGIGSGKSVVRRLLSLLLSAPSYDCDSRAKALYLIPEVREKVATLLGEDPIEQTGELRKHLLRSALMDKQLRPALEHIVHTAVERDFERFVEEADSPFVLIESAILYTSGLYRTVDCVLLVQSSTGERSVRARKRDGKEEAFDDMESLQSRERRLSALRADYRIDNSGSTSLIRQCEAILSAITNKEQ